MLNCQAHPVTVPVSRFQRGGMGRISDQERNRMRNILTSLYVKIQILKDESGQDLIEYALVVALIALAATAGMTAVASNINNAFEKIGDKLTTYVK
jgi:pilus assembly protein Flp/PilA